MNLAIVPIIPLAIIGLFIVIGIYMWWVETPKRKSQRTAGSGFERHLKEHREQ